MSEKNIKYLENFEVKGDGAAPPLETARRSGDSPQERTTRVVWVFDNSLVDGQGAHAHAHACD